MMAFSTATAQVRIVCPTVEHQLRQHALATNQPRFSWRYSSGMDDVVQTSYRIVVASSEEKASKGVGDLWDSKVVTSDQMIFIPYEGESLHSRDKAYWKIYATLTYDEKGGKRKKVKTESDVNSFEISLLNQEDWSAKWIGYDYDDDTLIQKTRLAARYLRKEFTLNKEVREARLYVCGLGQYSIGVNGWAIGDNDWLKPALSDYRKRVYFNAYDVTNRLRVGEGNAIGITLAGGRYMTMRYNKE